MHSQNPYHKSGYHEDVELSEELRIRREAMYAEVSPKIRALTVIAPIAIFSTVFIGFPVMIAAGLAFFVVMLMFIIRINRTGDRIAVHCPVCDSVMRKEESAGLEFHVCDSCKKYARGRDWS